MKKFAILLMILLPICIQIKAQWLPQNSGTNNQLQMIQFVNEQVGWAKGSYSGVYEIYKTTNGGSDWFLLYTHIDPLGLISFQNENVGFFTSFNTLGDYIYKTVDGGENWTLIYSGIIQQINDIEFLNSEKGWCVGWVEFGYLFKQTVDGGLTWTDKAVSPNYWGELFSIEVVNDLNFIITGSDTLFKSSDGGSNWQKIPITIGHLYDLQFFDLNLGWVKGYNINGGILYKTSNGGITWSQQAQPMRAFQFIDYQTGWYINNNLIYNTTTGGNIWSLQNSNTNNDLYDIFFLDNNTGYAVGNLGTIIKTENGGIPVELISFSSSIIDDDVTLYWQTATETNNQGFQIERSKKLEVRDGEWENIGFVDGNGTTTEPQTYSFVDENLSTGKYQYRLKQIDFNGIFEYSKIVEVEIAPTKFVLQQNYPNPFNPSTSIQYAISSRQFVTLKVYDVLGKEIATLVNEQKSTGSYETVFNVSHLASGIYYYQLRAGDYVETKKMIFLK